MSTVDAVCRLCSGSRLKLVLDLGLMPPSDRFLTREQLSQPEKKFPLKLVFCPDCSLVQITETVPPELLFSDAYIYLSSASSELLKHSSDNVHELIKDRGLNQGSFVIEIASNDGYLLKNYVEKGIPVIGIDPAKYPAARAKAAGIPTLNAFFTEKIARQLKVQNKLANVVHANNVLAHVDDTNGFVKGIRTILKDDGIAVIEVPYLKELVNNCEFDTIYHEHLCYFSVTALYKLFRRCGLFINKIKRLSIHGGSLRLYVSKVDRVDSSVDSLLEHECEEKIDQFAFYRDFSNRVQDIKHNLLNLLREIKATGKRIVGYGAAAKGTILLNTIGIGPDIVEYIVDRNIHKQGRYVPGQQQPIYSPDRIMEDMPDYVLLLPWNFADEILDQQKSYREKGGKFIIPIPELRVV
jgi:SAM-dependent methyltransferase